MRNRRTILFLLLAVVALVAAEVLLDAAGQRERVATRAFLAEDAASCTTLTLVRRTAPTTVLTKEGGWRLVSPFPASAEASVVLKLLDTLAQAPVEETITDAELLRLGRTRADFALEDPPLRVSLSNATVRLSIAFGLLTPSGDGVYAALEGSDSVLIVPSSVLSAVDLPVDRFRRRRLLGADAGTVSAFDIRQRPGVILPFVREGDGWRVGANKASTPFVLKFLYGLASAEAKAFVWPTGATNESALASASLLTGYGLDPESAVTVTLKRAGALNALTISFGKPADEQTVYAFVHNGGTVVTVDAALKEAALTDPAGFSDLRLFPTAAEKVDSLTLDDGGSVLSLTRAAPETWRIDVPISAPADAAAVASLLARLLALTTESLDPAGVSVTLGEGAKPVAVRRAALFPDGGGFERLRAREIVDLPANEIKRLVSVSGADAGRSVSVVFSRDRRSWNVESAAEGTSVSEAGVARVLEALAPLRAVRVEKLKVSASGLSAYGLDRPVVRLAVDLDRANAIRRNILIGARTPDGGHYATVGAADAVFVVSSEVVGALSAPLVENGPAREGAPERGGL